MQQSDLAFLGLHCKSTAVSYKWHEGKIITIRHNITHIKKINTGHDDRKVGAGRPTVLTVTEEREIVTTCQVLQELGFGLTRETVSNVISDFISGCARPSPFAGGLPGPDWWEGFMQCWPTLSEAPALVGC